ncbi:hypothetical protein PG985_008533 [Apiospora marii]|uniref:uncharacterized protein n=1 Tax=Apiospora marii TaxID=335849 RepID=UPI0031307A1E
MEERPSKTRYAQVAKAEPQPQVWDARRWVLLRLGLRKKPDAIPSIQQDMAPKRSVLPRQGTWKGGWRYQILAVEVHPGQQGPHRDLEVVQPQSLAEMIGLILSVHACLAQEATVVIWVFCATWILVVVNFIAVVLVIALSFGGYSVF